MKRRLRHPHQAALLNAANVLHYYRGLMRRGVTTWVIRAWLWAVIRFLEVMAEKIGEAHSQPEKTE